MKNMHIHHRDLLLFERLPAVRPVRVSQEQSEHVPLGLQQRAQNLEIIVTSSAQCSAAAATANHCWPGALLDAGEWCAPQTWETLQSELAEQQTPSHLRSETLAFNLVTQYTAARRI